MPRKPGSPNRGKRVEHQPIKHGKRRWHYDGTLFPDHLDITKVHGEISGPLTAALDAAIKTECRRLGVTINMDDRAVGDLMFKHVAVAP